MIRHDSNGIVSMSRVIHVNGKHQKTLRERVDMEDPLLIQTPTTIPTRTAMRAPQRSHTEVNRVHQTDSLKELRCFVGKHTDSARGQLLNN